MVSVSEQIQAVLSDRHAPESRAFFEIVLKYIDRRAHAIWHRRYRDLLAPTEIEEVVADVLTRLMSGSLARFRGETLPSLYAYLRTITDRTLMEAAHRGLRARRTQEALAENALVTNTLPSPVFEVPIADVPLSAKDQAYLEHLFAAGSLAELARRRGQSRAAVTRMVQRIRERIEALPDNGRMAVEAWIEEGARAAL